MLKNWDVGLIDGSDWSEFSDPSMSGFVVLAVSGVLC